MERGWIKIHRKMTEWEWFTDHVTLVVFFNLLMTVNYEDKKWRGVDIKRGQRIIGLSRFADEVGITLQQLRTSLKKLESTGDVTREATSQFTIISVVNFGTYQSSEVSANTPLTNEQQTNNIPATYEQQQLKNEKKERTKESKKRYSEFKNVLLLEEELSKLNESLGDELTLDMIERLGGYIEQKGKDRYRSHYATILAWHRKDGGKKKSMADHKEQDEDREMQARAEEMKKEWS